MKKVVVLVLLFMLCFRFAIAQKPVVDSLKKAYRENGQDTTLVKLLDVRSVIVYGATNIDSAMICARQGLALSRKIHYEYGEVRMLSNIARYLNTMGDLPGALRISYEVLPRAIKINEYYTIAACYHTLGLTYGTLNDLKKADEYYHKALIYSFPGHIAEQVFTEYNSLARNFIERNMPDSALWYNNKAYTLAIEKNMAKNVLASAIRNFGILEFKKGNYKEAINFYNKSLAQMVSGKYHSLESDDLLKKAEAYQQLNKLDSCIYFAKKAYGEAKLTRNPKTVMSIASLLSDACKGNKDYRQAYEYQQEMLKAQEILFSQQKTLQIQNVEFKEQQREQEIKVAEADYQTRLRFYAMLTLIAVFVLIALFLLYTNRARKKANKRLHQQNEQIQSQHEALEKTLADLKNTQTQLIQSAKMASLGELAAGIAHEIRNPLNFVNNFSEISIELMENLKAELAKGDTEEAKVITTDVIEKLGKINHHGKRAEGIVKGMLGHSRTTPGQKEMTDLNKLTDEYFRLAYYGFREKDKSFDAEMTTDLDSKLPKVDIIPQEIGRVLLNLYRNAFYAVNQKRNTALAGYKPEVSVSTSSADGWVIIKVQDNGTGISDAIKEKIMQPFFTTKPAGEGTGLGLSLSYDIVVKGHGGSIDVNTNDVGFTEFIVRLPL